MKTYVNSNSDIIKNDPELQPSDRMIELDQQLNTYSDKAQENLKKWAEYFGLPSDNVRIMHLMTSVGGVDFYHKWPFDVREADRKPSDLTLEMNVSAMGSFDPDVDSRETMYYRAVACFMTDSVLRRELKAFVFDYIYGLKKLENELQPLVRERENKIRAKVNEINAQIDKENYELQLGILKSIPADGNVFIIKDNVYSNTGFTYRNRPVLIAEKQEGAWNTKSVPARLVRARRRG